MIDHILDALVASGFERSDVVFVCGYRAEVLKRAYPDLSYIDNRDYAQNNILVSLLHARERMHDGFVSSYADIVYRDRAVIDAVASPHDLVLVYDTDWRRRYQNRSMHPESDAEKLRVHGDRIVELSRRIPAADASGEFIGVLKASARGAAAFIATYDAARAAFGDAPVFREGRSLARAYLIDLVQHMIEAGHAVYGVPIHGGYMEIDTLEDVAHAETWWHESER
jgi:choline kinase